MTMWVAFTKPHVGNDLEGNLRDKLFYARYDTDHTQYQGLENHLQQVARKTALFCSHFGSSQAGYLAGLYHDFGKYLDAFQERLLGARVFVEHSGAGAALAHDRMRMPQELGMALAFAIAGHHTGLSNLVTSAPNSPRPLIERLRENASLLPDCLKNAPGYLTESAVPEVPAFLLTQSCDRNTQPIARRRWEMWIRFLFAALVDADRLDAEQFGDPATTELRSRFSSIEELSIRIDGHLDSNFGPLDRGIPRSSVGQARTRILDACRLAADKPTGIFSLTVPTGGGKTLSAMSFALRHARHNGLRRVIVVIPYTSIIEQNAAVYAAALGSQNVIEHHSNLDPMRKLGEVDEAAYRSHELACENWDAPVIVTTSVQFLETLFSNHPSRCRKLHNVARSVIILDEVQTLPAGMLLPIVDGLGQLVSDYGCSLVLSTATPPALARSEHFTIGLADIRPIIDQPDELAKNLKRVNFTWPKEEAPVQWPQLAAEIAQHDQVLAVVHRRSDARILAEMLQGLVPDSPTHHLSTLMCAAHRTDVINTIRKKLAQGSPCRVVSTQLIEAGVDVDFPVVYRAMAGLDSIVQAGGRCNREGKLPAGIVVVFRAPTTPPPGTLLKGLGVAETLLCEHEGQLDLDDYSLLETYFRRLYFLENKDVHSIQMKREQFCFADVDRSCKVIDEEGMQPLLVPYGDVAQRLAKLERYGVTREGMRALQPFIVNVRPREFTRLLGLGAAREDRSGMWHLVTSPQVLYHPVFGLSIPN